MEMMADLATTDGLSSGHHSVANLNLCDRLLVLYRRQVAYFGPPEDA